MSGQRTEARIDSPFDGRGAKAGQQIEPDYRAMWQQAIANYQEQLARAEAAEKLAATQRDAARSFEAALLKAGAQRDVALEALEKIASSEPWSGRVEQVRIARAAIAAARGEAS